MPTDIRHGFWNYSAFIYLWHLQLKLCALRSVGSDLQLQQNVEGRNDFPSLICATVLLSWGEELGLVKSEAAVSTGRRWLSSLCTRGTSGSRTLGWNSLCTESSWVLSHGRILRAWRKSTCPLCHKPPEWHKVGERARITTDYMSFSEGRKLKMAKLAQHVDKCAGTYMSIGDVEQVFGAAALVELQFVTNGLLDDDIVGLLRRQNFIDILCRSHSVHLVGLKK